MAYEVRITGAGKGPGDLCTYIVMAYRVMIPRCERRTGRPVYIHSYDLYTGAGGGLGDLCTYIVMAYIVMTHRRGRRTG